MTIDKSFRDIITSEIKKYIHTISKDNTGFKQIWGCDSEKDFLYGWYVSETHWLCLHLFYDKYEREPKEKEMADIRQTILEFSKDIREEIKKIKSL